MQELTLNPQVRRRWSPAPSPSLCDLAGATHATARRAVAPTRSLSRVSRRGAEPAQPARPRVHAGHIGVAATSRCRASDPRPPPGPHRTAGQSIQTPQPGDRRLMIIPRIPLKRPGRRRRSSEDARLSAAARQE